MRLTWGPKACGRGVVLDTSTTDAEIGVLKRLAAGNTVLEVGSCWGYSALQLAQVAKHVFAVDPHLEERGGIPGSLPTMRQALRIFELESKVTICLSHSQEVLPALEATGAKFDLIFIDGDHRAPAVEHDLHHSLPLLSHGGALCFHDYTEQEWPDVQRVLDRFYPAGPTHHIDSLWVKSWV